MSRFDYLGAGGGKKAKKAARRLRVSDDPTSRDPGLTDAERRSGATQERLERVYVRKETVRAVWREVKKDGGESVSELVEDLLLAWLRGRVR